MGFLLPVSRVLRGIGIDTASGNVTKRMLRSYFVTGIRNLLNKKIYSFIKILGLSFGLAASIMIYLYIQEDLLYDTMHEKYDRIVRLLTIDSAEGVSSKHVGVTQPRLAPAAKEELPEVLES